MAIISFYSGSYCHSGEVINEVAKELGYDIIDEAVIAETAKRFNVSESKLLKAMEDDLPAFSRFTNERARLVAMLRLVLSEMIQKDNVILCGMAGHLVPHTITHFLKVCIIANFDYRLKQAVDSGDISDKKAEKEIRGHDKNLTQWTDFLYNKGAYDENLYDIVLPMHDKTIEDAVAQICIHAQSDALKTTDLSTQIARDFMLAAKVWNELVKQDPEVEVFAEDGTVTIIINKYVIRLEKHQNELKKIAGKIDGVKEVKTRTGSKFSPPSIMPMGDLDMPSKILLVDDEKEFVETLSERLETRNLESSVVYDGEQALDFINKDEPEVMVLDLKMPGIDGIEVLRRVKKEHPRVEVIILTGHGSEREETIASELGAFAYLQKPVDVDLLAQVMKAAYEKVNETHEDDETVDV